MTDTDEWYSEDALLKQAALDDLLARGEHVPLDVWCGLLAPRVQPSEAEKCANCESDARDQVGGEEIGGKRWCPICIGRGRHTDHVAGAYRSLAVSVQRIRGWCDRTESVASGDQSEAVFQARMELVDEVRALLPEVAS